MKAPKPTYKRKKAGKTEKFAGFLKRVGSKKKADKIGLHSLTEDETNTQSVTQYPVDGHNAVTDHVRRESKVISLTVRLDEGTMAKTVKVYNKLNYWGFKGIELQYHGAGIAVGHCVISSLAKHIEKYQTAMDVTIELTYVYFVTTSVIKHKKAKKKKGKREAKSSKSKSKKSKKKYVRVKRGDTYWLYHQKTGASIASLRKWNKYPDRRIPIGVRVRIK
ncbi:LysM peptidoglycan-binding domain-containing protein [Lactiplantibacillus xiangfangensis]|uniref:LysM peptidoglycan-binding domain-containing protein n=1 Tax=Lactiplantibacillus xiangfangensis TaxID=942150 RepID=UPI00384A5E2D